MTKKEKIYEEWRKIGIEAPVNINGWAFAKIAVEAQLKTDYEIDFDYKTENNINYARPVTLRDIEINNKFSDQANI